LDSWTGSCRLRILRQGEKLGGVAGGKGECGDDVAGWLVRERRSLDILPVKKEAKLSASSGVLGGIRRIATSRFF